MAEILLNVIFPVLCCVLVGVFWGRYRNDFATNFVTKMVASVGAPCLIVATLNEADLSWQAFRQMATLALAAMGGFTLLGFCVFKVLGMTFKPLSLAVIFPNTGNMGLSLCLFAFGEEGLALALIVFVVVSMVHFACGDFVLLRAANVRQRIANLFKQPIFLSTLFATWLVLTGSELPKPVALTVKLIGGMTIPLMLITLGVSLASIRSSQWGRGITVALVRVPGGMLIALLIIYWAGVEGMPANILLLQSIMPSAVFNYFFALKYNTEIDAVASGVVISTALSFLVLPPVLWVMLN